MPHVTPAKALLQRLCVIQTPVLGLLIALTFPALGKASPEESLRPITAAQWNRDAAAHLLERAGFGGTPEEIAIFTSLGPDGALASLLKGYSQDNLQNKPQDNLPAFEHSGVFKDALDPFPPSRPATTAMAKREGEALGIKVKPAGNRPVQAIVNEFFYWLRASRLETDRVAYWWANRMLTSDQPLREKMALFWHGHFATNEDKVRDYRKMLKQLELFEREGLGNFRDLLIGVAQDPAMLAFLDAGVNVKGSPNENFAREIMELFTMGVGHYSEEDVREAARAFTGWNFDGLEFRIDPEKQDNGLKTFLGETRNFGGIQIIDRILAQPATAEFIAGKLYRYFVSEDLDPNLNRALGKQLKAMNYELRPFMAMLLSSQDFYTHRGTRIKPPVELVVSTYKKLGLVRIPGNPDFNEVTEQLGQRLMHPPTVAGWSGGRSWITAGLLFERGNFVLDVVFPDIAFIPPDRYPFRYANILPVHERLRAGMDISSATQPEGVDTEQQMMAASNLMADKDEDFNTRYGNYRGWQMAIERVKPIPRDTAHLELRTMVLDAKLRTPDEVITYFVRRFMTVPPDDARLESLTAWLTEMLGTANIREAESYIEEPLRQILHALLSQPEYQLG